MHPPFPPHTAHSPLLPQGYFRPDYVDFLSELIIADPGFVSTTLDVDIATVRYGGPCVFAFRGENGKKVPPHFLGNGANVQWVSQYPCETERLLPSSTLCIPDMNRKSTAEWEEDERFRGRKVRGRVQRYGRSAMPALSPLDLIVAASAVRLSK